MAETLLSVGIDVGTSTTQVVFSRLTLEDKGNAFSAPRIAITKKQVIFRGAVHETPLHNPDTIDAQALRRLVEQEFAAAGIPVGGTDTGAVIITGESARKENAAQLLQALSGFAGDFVVAAAGPDLESRIAGQGSGAQAQSEALRCRAANLDIGGGTANLAVFDCGRLAGVSCYNIGGRQLRFAPGGQISYISESAREIAAALGIPVFVGATPAMADLRRLAQAMAQLLEAAVAGESSPLLERVRTAGSAAAPLPPADCVLFSGGVADCIYTTGQEPFAYGDFGVLLGEAVRQSGLLGRWRVLAPSETIRATVIGAGSFSLTLSGSTVGYSSGALFPLKNLPVCLLSQAREEAAFAGEAADSLAQELQWFLRQHSSEGCALALAGKANPGWQELKRLAGSLGQALGAALPPGQPMILLLAHDMGKALAQAMQPYAAGRELAVLDGIAVQEEHYIDLGLPRMQGRVVPVVVKTLLFGAT